MLREKGTDGQPGPTSWTRATGAFIVAVWLAIASGKAISMAMLATTVDDVAKIQMADLPPWAFLLVAALYGLNRTAPGLLKLVDVLAGKLKGAA